MMPASVRDSGKFLQEEDGAAGPVVDGFRVHSLQVRTSVFTEAIRNGNLPVSLFDSLSAIFIGISSGILSSKRGIVAHAGALGAQGDHIPLYGHDRRCRPFFAEQSIEKVVVVLAQ